MMFESRFSPSPIALAIYVSLSGSVLMTGTADAAQTNSLTDEEPVQELAVTRVDEQSDETELSELSAVDIRVATRSDLSEALSIIPSVRVSNTASTSTQQGDLKPAEFSIRGAAPYQNNIQLDNSSIDSLLDPANKLRFGDYPSRTSVSGHSQSLFIDPDFLSSLVVIDNNASAKEGSFTGGVVKATTRGYQGSSEFSFSHRITKDSWTEFHIDPTQLDEFEEGADQRPTGVPGRYQPNFDKSESSVSGAFRAGDIGYFVGLSEKRSEITQKSSMTIAATSDLDYFLDTGHAFKPAGDTDLHSHSRYLTVRADLLDADYDLYATLSVSDFEEESLLMNFVNSGFTSDITGYNLSVNYGDDFGNTRVDSNLSINISDNRRDADLNEMNEYNGRNFYTDGSFFGAYGDLETQQERLSWAVDFVTPLGGDGLRFNYGAKVDHVRLKQHRPYDYVDSEYYPSSPDLNSGLAGPVPYEEHHLYRRVVYGAGDIGFNETNLAVYGELAAKSDNGFYRAGLRVDRDAWLGNNNLSPRLSGGLYLDDEQSLTLEAGVNRYYGKSFLSYRLRDEEKKNVVVTERESVYDSSAPLNTFAANDQWISSKLDTPYNDEYMVGIKSANFSGAIGLNLVIRDGKDQIRTQYNSDDDTYRYLNSGESYTEQADLYWRSERYEWLQADWLINATLSWMDSETDAQYLNGGYGQTEDATEEVLFNGERIRRVELPADDFATPISANVDVIAQFFSNRLHVRNGFSFTNGYQYLNRFETDEQTGLDSYRIEDQGSTFNWDLGIEYALFGSESSPYLRLDVVNVTDNDNVVRYEQGTQLFSLGRQFWLEVGYRF